MSRSKVGREYMNVIEYMVQVTYACGQLMMKFIVFMHSFTTSYLIRHSEPSAQISPKTDMSHAKH